MPVDDRAFQLAADRLILRVNEAARRIATEGALAVQAAGMRHSPVLSGTLRRSWRTTPGEGLAGVYSAEAGPTVIYARRIELGFMGPDSLGRVYDQKGDPYVAPARRETLPSILALARKRVAGAITGL